MNYQTVIILLVILIIIYNMRKTEGFSNKSTSSKKLIYPKDYVLRGKL